jgi:hypothetical protein
MRKESRRSLTIALAALSVLAVGCNYAARVSDQVAGSGNRKTERREVGEFDELLVKGAYRVEVTSGQSLSVEVEADDNVLPLIKTEVVGGRLTITQSRGFKMGALPRVRIGVPDMKFVAIDGASDFELAGVANERLGINVDGAGRLRASGETDALDVELNGAARIDAGSLRARNVNVESNGAGLTTVHATETLNATLNGVGGVDYYGEPKVVNPKINGLGRISKK